MPNEVLPLTWPNSRLGEIWVQIENTKGHDVRPLTAWGHGSSVQMMEVLSNGTYAFGSDPRCEGHAAGI